MNPTWLNPHRMMLFFYVARYGGFSKALPHIPYGIQQPAASEALGLLSEEVGVKLYESHPFCLTPAGVQLYEFVRPYYETLPDVLETIRTGTSFVHLGASELVSREYIPTLKARLRQRDPGIRLALERPGTAPDILTPPEGKKLDAVVAAVSEIPPGMTAIPITRLPLVLLAPKSIPASVFNAKMLRMGGKLSLPLICPPLEDAACLRFYAGLAERKIHWHFTTTTSSVALVPYFVSRDEGIGLCLDLPILTKHPGVRVIKLPDFAPVDIVAVSRPSPTPQTTLLLDTLRDYAAELRSSHLVPALAEVSAPAG
jgi:DNA-binding transcriptional LysR family regulator